MRKSNSLVRSGSNGALRNRETVDNALLFMNADTVLLCDLSGSMSSDADGEHSCWDVLVQVVNALDLDKTVLAGFNTVVFMVGGTMPQPSGLTDIGIALCFLKPVATFVKKVVLLSDGLPNVASDDLSPQESALQAARNLGVPIDVVYCGGHGGDEAFLRKLASSVGGEYHCGSFREPLLLTEQIQRLLLTAPSK